MKDGFILFYSKDDQILPIVMSNDQYITLQALIPAVFGNETIQVINKPMGEVYNMADKIREATNGN